MASHILILSTFVPVIIIVKRRGFSTCPSIPDVKEGAVLCVILVSVYIDDLLKILRKKQSECWINNDFFGIIRLC